MPPPLTHPEEDLLVAIEPEAAPPPELPRWSSTQEIRGPRGAEWLSEALLDASPTRPGRITLRIFSSVFLHILVLTILVLLPLMFTETLDFRQFTQTLLVAPPPPPPPPPPPAAAVLKTVRVPKRVFSAAGKLMAPTVIPERVAMLKEEPLPPDIGIGVTGGVPGGVPGGQMGGVIGGIIGSAGTHTAPIAPPPEKHAPIRVGGRVKAPQIVYGPQPIYPALARHAKVQGDVLIDAVIDPEGRVVEMRLVSGHPLLVEAALNAVKQWRYQPTLLNDEPVSIQLVVIVQFRLYS